MTFKELEDSKAAKEESKTSDLITKEALQKQLQLLSERSEVKGSDLPSLAHAMVEIAMTLLNLQD